MMPNRSLFSALAVITLFWGVVHIALGGCFMSGGASLVSIPPDGAVGGFAPILGLVGGLMTVLGVAFLVQGLLAIAAALGILWRRGWGTALTVVLAVLSILWGLFSLAAYEAGAAYVAFGAGDLLYGIFAVVILVASRQNRVFGSR